MTEYEIAVIGAGKTGRGFIGRLLQDAGKPFVLLDRDELLVKKLKNAGEFKVGFFSGCREPVAVRGFHVEYTGNSAVPELLRHVKLVFVSVGGTNLAEVGKWLAHAFEKRLADSPEACSFITCENAGKPADQLKKAFLSSMSEKEQERAGLLYGFSEATVFCTTIEDENLNILSENYPRIQCDAQPLKGNMPKIQGLLPVKAFENFLLRKIYTYNSASAAISYLGWLKGYTVYSEAANDEEILQLLTDLYREVGNALCKAYGYDPEDQREFAELSLRKFRDRTITDTIARNAREPQRKLAFNERIIGPAQLIQEYGGDSRPLEVTAAAALLYEDPEDAEWMQLKKSLGVEGILGRFCRLTPDSSLYRKIVTDYQNIKENGFAYK